MAALRIQQCVTRAYDAIRRRSVPFDRLRINSANILKIALKYIYLQKYLFNTSISYYYLFKKGTIKCLYNNVFLYFQVRMTFMKKSPDTWQVFNLYSIVFIIYSNKTKYNLL